MIDEEFERERRDSIRHLAEDTPLQSRVTALMAETNHHRYPYHFDWLGLPIIQYPADIVAVQELLWRVKPAVVVETGVARGGSLALSASILELLGGERHVIGVDIDIRPRNRAALEEHPLSHRINLVEGSSIDPHVVEEVYRLARGRGPVVVLLDSMHTFDHVLAELRAYSSLVTAGSYIVVFDTIIEQLPPEAFPDRPWGVGNNPMTAVRAFLRENDRFEIDDEVGGKLLMSAAPNGFLRCVR